MSEIKEIHGRFYLGQFNPSTDVNQVTKKGGIAKYTKPQNKFALFFARLFKMFVNFKDGNQNYTFNARSFKKWAKRHGESDLKRSPEAIVRSILFKKRHFADLAAQNLKTWTPQEKQTYFTSKDVDLSSLKKEQVNDLFNEFKENPQHLNAFFANLQPAQRNSIEPKHLNDHIIRSNPWIVDVYISALKGGQLIELFKNLEETKGGILEKLSEDQVQSINWAELPHEFKIIASKPDLAQKLSGEQLKAAVTHADAVTQGILKSNLNDWGRRTLEFHHKSRA